MTFFTTLPPERTGVPSPRTTRAPMTQSRGWKYRRRDGPPAALASVPPTVARSGRPGSTGQLCPRGARASASSANVVPARTVATRSPGSYSTMPRTAERSRAASYRAGGSPTPSRVAPPLTTSASPRSFAPRIASTTSASFVARMTLRGATPSMTCASRPIAIPTCPPRARAWCAPWGCLRRHRPPERSSPGSSSRLDRTRRALAVGRRDPRARIPRT